MVIDKCNEVHGTCHHKRRLHRFDQSQNANTSTDESDKDERVTRPSSATLSGSSSCCVGLPSNRRESNLLCSDEDLSIEEGNLPQVESDLDEPPLGD